MTGGWVLVPLGVESEAFYVPSGYKVLDPETLLLEAEQAVRNREEASE
jgi:hypothetical protein